MLSSDSLLREQVFAAAKLVCMDVAGRKLAQSRSKRLAVRHMQHPLGMKVSTTKAVMLSMRCDAVKKHQGEYATLAPCHQMSYCWRQGQFDPFCRLRIGSLQAYHQQGLSERSARLPIAVLATSRERSGI